MPCGNVDQSASDMSISLTHSCYHKALIHLYQRVANTKACLPLLYCYTLWPLASADIYRILAAVEPNQAFPFPEELRDYRTSVRLTHPCYYILLQAQMLEFL